MKNTLFVPALLSMQLVTTISGQAPPRRDTNGTNNAATSPAESMKWIQVRPGQEISALWGDQRTGPNGRFNRFAAGFKDRPHFHTRDLYSVVVSGTVVVQTAGNPAQELGPGSDAFVPAKTPHTHSCKEGMACVIFVYQDGPSDSISVEPTQ
jgi:mannose-6-phosphate isomerase-like protein (cupin superfamily)